MMNTPRILFALALLAVGLCGCQPETPANRTAETRQERREQRQAERQERRAERQAGEDAAPAPSWFGAVQATLQNARASITAPFIRPRLRPERLPEQVFALSVGDTTTITTRAGFRFSVPPNALVDAQGRPFTGAAVLAVREAMTVQDFIRAGLVTVAGQDPLMSGGMFHLSARDARTGKELRLTPGKTIKGETPVMDKPYDLYTGKITPNGGLDWVNPVPMRPLYNPFDNTGELVRRTQVERRRGVNRELAENTLIPISTELLNRLVKIRKTLAEVEQMPVVKNLKYNTLSYQMFLWRLVNLRQQIEATRNGPAPQPTSEAFAAWSRDQLPTVPLRFQFVWYQGRVLLHRQVLGQLGFSARELDPRMAEGAARQLPRSLRKEYLDATELLTHLSQAQTLFRQILPTDTSSNPTCKELFKCAQAVAAHLQPIPFQREVALRTAASESANANFNTHLLLIDGKLYASIAALRHLGFYPNELSEPDLFGPLWRTATRARATVWDYETTCAYLNAQTQTDLWAGVVKGTNPDRSMTYQSRDSFLLLTSVADTIIENEYESVLSTPERKDLNAALINRFGFDLNNLGWINCDIFYGNPSRIENVTVNLPAGFTPGNTQLYVVYPDIRSVFSFEFSPGQPRPIRVLNTSTGYVLLVSGEQAVKQRITRGQPIEVGFTPPSILDQLFTTR